MVRGTLGLQFGSYAYDKKHSTVSFKYDPFGRRIYKSSSSATSIYAYDHADVIEETNGAGSAVARYTQSGLLDEPLVMLRSGTTSYYEQDGLGSVTSLSSTPGMWHVSPLVESRRKLTIFDFIYSAPEQAQRCSDISLKRTVWLARACECHRFPPFRVVTPVSGRWSLQVTNLTFGRAYAVIMTSR